MTDKELLARAKRDYPVGTVVVSTGGAGQQMILRDKFYIDYGNLRASPNCQLYSGRNNKWAEIVSLPKGYYKETYQIY